LLSGIRGRQADLPIARRAPLVAFTHGNQYDASKSVFVFYACEANETLSIVMQAERDGFNPMHCPSPNEARENEKRELSF
jgi:hypothetical protein